jgi:hypothetical protein
VRGHTLLVAALALALPAACSSLSTRATREHGVITKPGQISVFDLQPGDCLLPDGVVGGDVEEVRAVPCKDPHTHEVFAIPQYTGSGTFPGRRALERFAAPACRKAVPAYLGTTTLDSSLTLSYLVPSAKSWADEDDRQVTCVLVTTGNKVAGSLRKSAG